MINLTPGATSTIDNTPLTLSPLTTVKSAYAGDGNDLLVGNGIGNLLYGGRGDDTFYPGLGDNTLDGGPGFNVAFIPGDLLDNSWVHTSSGNAVITPTGTDTLRNISLLAFRDTLMPVSSLNFLDQSLLSGSFAQGSALGVSG